MRFNVHALDAAQQVVALSFEAASPAAARALAQERGLSVFSVEGGKRALALPRLAPKSGFRTGLFTVELLSLLDAGLNLVEAMQTLAEKEPEGPPQRRPPGRVAAITRGEPFSQAVAAFPQHFSPLYVATIKASERTGNVKEALGRYIAYQDELDRVKKKVVSASIYPAILMVVGTLVIGFLMLYVVPRFAQVYEDMAHKLPFFSQLLLSFGSFVGKHGFFMFSVFILGIGAAAWALSRPAVRAALNRRLWALPALGSRMKTYQLARLYRTAGVLIAAGTPALRALQMVEGLLAAHLPPPPGHARNLIEQGQPTSAALCAPGLPTPVAARVVLVGERNGDIG